MTPLEREQPELIDGSRRARIATGSGTTPSEVGALVTQFGEVQRMMKRFGGFGSKKVKAGRKAEKKKAKLGGRTTSKGPAPMPEVDLSALAERPKGGGLRLPGR